MTDQRKVQIIITGCALLALILSKVFSFEWDNETLVLLVLAALPWMAPLIKTIKLPGIGEVEFNELKNEVTEVNGVANRADKNASLAQEDIGKISVFVFKSLINKKERDILLRLESKEPYEINTIDGMSNKLYQLRDSELITMDSVKDLKKMKSVGDFKKYAKITEHGRNYLKYWRSIKESESNKTMNPTTSIASAPSVSGDG